MKLFYGLLLTATLALVGCGDSTKKPADQSGSSNPLNAPAEYGGALANAQNKAVKTVDVASLNAAVQMFNVQEGRNPKDLSELVEKKYLPSLPAAPTGSKFSYDAGSGKVTVVPK